MIIKKKGSFYILIFISLFVSLASSAGQFESHQKIKLEIEKFIQNNTLDTKYPVVLEPINISPKVKVKTCFSSLSISYSNPTKPFGHTTIQVKCEQPAFWKMNIPVVINQYDDVLWLKNPIARGQNIDENDVIAKKMNVSKLIKGYFIHFDQLKSLQTKRALKANSILTPNQFKARNLVKTGQLVTVILKTNNLNIKTSATALQSASKGKLVKVRNNSTLKILSGIVTAEGTVQVHL